MEEHEEEVGEKEEEEEESRREEGEGAHWREKEGRRVLVLVIAGVAIVPVIIIIQGSHQPRTQESVAQAKCAEGCDNSKGRSTEGT